MWPYVTSAELGFDIQEVTAEWILLLDACQPLGISTMSIFLHHFGHESVSSKAYEA